MPEEFLLNENDYCVGQRKWGGNAQSLVKDRFLHHTSILWQTDLKRMERYLRLPPLEMRPEYRRDRPHSDFVVGLQEVLREGMQVEDVWDSVVERVEGMFEHVEEADAVSVVEDLRKLEYRKSTELVDLVPYMS